ncbi:hypothetical protein A9Q89_01570 [Gammaproteobacteria bacterium 53_120_T64]|nr:hypothetical protein A9Q89_01570 [Gammaproteobacteria bacterium 53_120_T64]
MLASGVVTSSPSLAGNCRTSDLDSVNGSDSGERVGIQYVYDGDTVTLKDGRKIRLIGINTPERGRRGKPDQPLALAAKQALQTALLATGNSRAKSVRLYLGREPVDTYGRQLGYLFVNGESLAEMLLSKGLGWHVVLPPNTGLAACLAAAEQAAKRRGKGLWQRSLRQFVRSESLLGGGYQRVRGRVSKVSFAKAWWINFDDGFVAVIYPENQRYFDRKAVSAWRGKRLEIEGWVYAAKYRGKRQWRIKLATHYGVTLL